MGMSAKRKGWVLLDPKTRKLPTSNHVTFDENMAARRCALRDFDLRQTKKAGPGASADDEREAKLERSMYDDSPDLQFEDSVNKYMDEAATVRELKTSAVLQKKLTTTERRQTTTTTKTRFQTKRKRKVLVHSPQVQLLLPGRGRTGGKERQHRQQGVRQHLQGVLQVLQCTHHFKFQGDVLP